MRTKRYFLAILLVTFSLTFSVFANGEIVPGIGASPSGEKTSSWQTAQLGFNEIEVTATLPDYPSVRVRDYRGFDRERCPTCHTGIEEISRSHPRNFGCTVCHGGDGSAYDAPTAHASLIYDPAAGAGRRNPSSLRVVEKTCGQQYCHASHAREDRNHIQRVKKSMMATLAGVISGLRYQWAGQSGKTAKFGMRSIQDRDGRIPHAWGAIARLDALPFFSQADLLKEYRLRSRAEPPKISHHIGDSLLRAKCSQCHIDSPGMPGKYRSQGCAACHFQYNDEGRYQGNDPVISKTQPGHPAYHRMTALTPNKICVQCHRAFDQRTLESAFSNPSQSDGDDFISFAGEGTLKRDVHLERGFDCIDCHTQFDIMGDGNLYSKQHQAVEIRCETCHGTVTVFPSVAQVTDRSDRVIRLSRHYPGWNNRVGDWMAVSAKNRKLTNVKALNKGIVTLGKQSGKQFMTPLIKNKGNAHRISQHMDRLECVACHSQWAPKCSGCHSAFDQSETSKTGAPKQPGWSPVKFAMQAEEPQLMIGPRGKVAPMLPQPARKLNALDERGKPITAIGIDGDGVGRYGHWEFTNPHGYSGSNLAYAFNPHTVQKQVRSCASCHLNPQALGLGEGQLVIARSSSGKNDSLVPLNRSNAVKGVSNLPADAKVTARGKPIAGSHQPGARPFNQREIQRILKVGNCIPCHDHYNDRIYRNIQRSYRYERTKDHQNLRNKILSKR